MTQKNDTDPNKPDDTKPGDGGNPQTQVTPPAQPTVEELIAERDKWKALSKKNEDNYKAASKERDDLKTAQMSDHEKALEAARTEGRTSALGEVSKDLVTKELALQAALKGVDLPNLEFLDLDRFKGDDAKPNAETVKSFIESLPKKQGSNSDFPHLQGAGHNKGSDGKFTSLDPNKLADYITDGSFI